MCGKRSWLVLFGTEGSAATRGKVRGVRVERKKGAGVPRFDCLAPLGLATRRLSPVLAKAELRAGVAARGRVIDSCRLVCWWGHCRGHCRSSLLRKV